MQNLYIDTKYMMGKSLKSMTQLLSKVATQMQERGNEEQELLQTRLAPDMFPLVRQIQMVSDNAKGAMGRLAGVETPSMEDTETSFAELATRLEKTLAFVESIKDEDLQAADTRQITMSYFPGKYFTAEDYVRDSAIPNFYFHFVTAYALLRMKGYDIGKADFIGSLNLRDL